MAKKKNKKSSNNNDRGYSTSSSAPKISNSNSSNVPQKSKITNKPSRQLSQASSQYTDLIFEKKGYITLSYDAHQQLTTLIDELSRVILNCRIDEKKNKKRNFIDINDHNLFSKIIKLYDSINTLGFSDYQIQLLFTGYLVGNVTNKQSTVNRLFENDTSDFQSHEGNTNKFMTLDAALDWFCLNLPYTDLPSLFTDVNIQDGDKNNLLTVEVSNNKSEQFHSRETEQDTQMLNQNVLSTDVKSNSNEDSLPVFHISLDDDQKPPEHSKIDKIQKSWILNQYQYEEEDDNNNNNNNNNNDEIYNDLKRCKQNDSFNNDDTSDRNESSNNNMIIHDETTSSKSLPLEISFDTKSIKERQLDKLEKEIKEDELTLSDDVANYMRSKYENKEIQNRLKKAKLLAKGLRAQIAKEKRKAEEMLATSNINDDNDSDICFNDDENGLLNMFDEDNITGSSPLEVLVVDQTNTASKLSMLSMQNQHCIPKSWTGTTPESHLLEVCNKEKRPKPTFQTIPHTRNGCMLTLKSNKQSYVQTFEDKGPFFSYQDAKHFLATKALYSMFPKQSLYKLFPLVFQDLWKSWIDDENSARINSINATQEEKENRIRSLVSAAITDVEGDKGNDLHDECKSNSLLKKNDCDNWDNGSDEYDDESNRNPSFQGRLVSPSKKSSINERLRESFIQSQKSDTYKAMMAFRQSLPIFNYRDQIVSYVNEHPVTVVCAETGAGKTTQCPQYILENALLSGHGADTFILCTQPRRISAISVSERVAEEMDEEIGGKIGYQIRMESRRSKHTKLLFCTTGVVLRRLQDDPELKGVTHVIVDEVHERQWQTDFLLIALRQLLQTTRKDMKVILMSATLDSQLFCSFFEGAPFFSIPGRMFPVSEYYLEDLIEATGHVIEEGSRYCQRISYGSDNIVLSVTGKGRKKGKQICSLQDDVNSYKVSDDYIEYSMSTRRSMDRVKEDVVNYDLIEDLLTLMLINTHDNKIILPPGASLSTDIVHGSILVFLPGIGEIKELNNRLESHPYFSDSTRFDIIPLHSTISPKDQRRAFAKPKNGCKKIILSTNIAETSVTITDCTCVIDTGLVREILLDRRLSTSKLMVGWCSKASAKQRTGRAGRVQPGISCKLFSSKTSSLVMKEHSMPELQRLPLEEVCLNILAGKLSSNCMEFLKQAPQPPLEKAVHAALTLLEEVDAISYNPDKQIESLTSLGSLLAKLPIHVKLGKIILFGSLFKCLDKCLTIAACLSCKSVFQTSIDDASQSAAMHRIFLHPCSDFLTLCNVWDSFQKVSQQSTSQARKFCEKHFLSFSSLKEVQDMRRHLLGLLGQLGFVNLNLIDKSNIESSPYNTYGYRDDVLNFVICAGLYPNIAHCEGNNDDKPPVLLQHKSEQLSIHSSSTNHHRKRREMEWLVFFEKFGTNMNSTSMTTTCLIKPFSLLLFGRDIVIYHTQRKVIVDGWITLKIPAQTAVLFQELRRKMSVILARKFTTNENVTAHDYNIDDTFIDGIVRLIARE